MNRQPIGIEESPISPETLRRFSLGLLEDDEAERVAAYLERFPEAVGQVEAIAPDSFLRKIREAGGETLNSTADSTNHLESRPQASAALEYTMPTENASTIPNLHPELGALTQYRFIKELGAGGMSLVYLAENLHMGGRKEALKILNASQMRQAGAKERFEQEIAVAANLNHPHVVTAYSAMRLPSLAVFVMQYVEGQDLEQYVRARGPLRISVACGIISASGVGLAVRDGHANDPSRYQTSQLDADQNRLEGRREDSGFWVGEGTNGIGQERRPNVDGDGDGYAALHGPRAIAQCGQGRHSRGHLFAGLHDVLPARRSPAFHRHPVRNLPRSSIARSDTAQSSAP